MRNSLWSRSSVWRWTLILTTLSTIAAILGSPWISLQPRAHKAQYIPPASPKGGLPNTTQNPQSFNLSPTAAKVAHSSPQKPTRDTTFDIAIPRPAEIFPPDTELHMIGVYEGALPDGVKETPWWAKCTDSNGAIAPSVECHQKYAGQREPKKVTVEIHYGAPLVLALMSYDPVIWEIQGEDPSQLQKVILAGYYGQDITGIDENVPVDVYTYEPSSCRTCRKEPGYFYTHTSAGKEYADAVAKLKTFTGLEPYSFQGSYKANFFALTPAIARKKDDHDQPISSYDEPSSGQIYSDHITLANTQIPLPAGIWQVIAYARIPHGAKEDVLISLAQNVDGVLKSLYAARIEVVANNMRFAGNRSCQDAENYFAKTVSDSPDGTPLCYWIEHLNSPWQRPLFDITASRLKAMGVKIPSNVVNIGFYKANTTTTITAYLYANPEAESIYTQPSNWHASPWNKNRIHRDPKRESFMNEQQQWAETWVQFFRLD